MNTKMNWAALALLGAVTAVPAVCSAQTVIPIGNIQRIEDAAPTTWAMSGYAIFNVSQSDGQDTPVTRTLRYDARTVEILSRTQNPPLSASDVKVMTKGSKYYVVVRRYLLAEVQPQDAKAVNMSQSALAAMWAKSVGKVLVAVAPLPSKFGI